MRLLRYGRLRDIESLILYPSVDQEADALREVFFPGTFSHKSTYTVNQHFSARIPGSLLSYERGRPVIYSRTWNHLAHFRPELQDGKPVAYVSYGSLRCPQAPRAAVERHFSVALPWKVTQSGGARKSFASTMLFEPPELSTDDIEESEEEAGQEGQSEPPGPLAQAAARPSPRRARSRRVARVRSWGSRLHRWLWGLGGP